ncbi:DEAD-box family helicase, partial [Plasmodium cynomolgi strain B]
DLLYAYEICFFIGKKLKFFRPAAAKVGGTVETAKVSEPVEITKTSELVDAAKTSEPVEITKTSELVDAAKTSEPAENAHATPPRDVAYLGSLNHVSDYVELVDNQKNADEELTSLSKSILASYKLYYAMRPKVSKYASTKCVNKVNKIGGVYKLCLFYHPDEIYENVPSDGAREEEIPPRGEEPSGKQPNGKEPNGKEPSGNQPSEQQPSEQQPSENQPSERQPNEGADRKEATNAGDPPGVALAQPKNYTHNEVMTIIHNFQSNDSGKVKGISDGIKEKLNKLKERMHTTKRSRSGEATDDVDELMGALAMGLSDHDHDSDYELEHLWKDSENGSAGHSGEGQTEPGNKPKKMSKRALKKKKKEEQQRQKQEEQQNGKEPTSGEPTQEPPLKEAPPNGRTKRSKINIPFDDILKKINKKKIKQETAAAFAIKTPGFDLPPDEEEELNKQRFIKKKVWDMRKRKFVLQEIDTFQSDGFKKKDRRKDVGGAPGKGNHGEGGADEPTSNLYHKWVKRTKNRIKNVGELEDEKNQKGRKTSVRTKQTHHHSGDGTTSNQLDDEKQTHLQMLKQNHPEITDSLSKNIKLTKKQQRLYKKYLSGRYMDPEPNSSLHKSLSQMQKEKAKMLQKKLRTDKDFRVRYARMKKKRHEQKLREKENLKSARARSLAIVKRKKIGKRGGK